MYAAERSTARGNLQIEADHRYSAVRGKLRDSQWDQSYLRLLEGEFEMTQQDQNRADWKVRVEMLMSMRCEMVDAEDLAGVQLAIRRCPYGSVSDAIMRLNSGCWLFGERYDLCLAALLRNGYLEAGGFGVFRIDRVLLPQIKVYNAMAEAMMIYERKPVVESGPPGPPDVQWDLF